MKWVVGKEFITFEDLERELEIVQSLLWILRANYFSLDEETVIKDPHLLTAYYRKYDCLLSAIMGAVQDVEETFNIVRENYEQK